ncbi:hypothetical protein ACLRGI_00750 [Paenarthrobacter nitroguajacolicus]|uniref:hypothetical protein n=1 Tax=Paenarthrobacter nitroguajacolicus TaxID=211146 RepID=UPI003ADF9AA0
MAEHNGGNRGGNRGNFGGNRDDRGSYRPNNNSGGDPRGFRSRENRDGNDRPARDGERRPFNNDRGDRPARDGERRSFGGDRDRKPFGDRTDRPARDGERRSFGDRSDRPARDGERRPFNNDRGDRKPFGDRPERGGERRSFGGDRTERGGAWEERPARVPNAKDIRSANRPDRERSPEIDEDVTGKELDRATGHQIKTLEEQSAGWVAKHLVMAGRLIDIEPELAFQHALAASRRGGRLSAVREAVGLTAYAAGHYGEALREFRTYRRISGSNVHLPVMADCERGLGRPDRALDMVRSPEAQDLDAPGKVELAIVASGARADLNQLDAAVSELEIPQLDINRAFSYSPRLFRAYAEALSAVGRTEEADKWARQALVAENALGVGDFAEPEILDLGWDEQEEAAARKPRFEKPAPDADVVKPETETVIVEAAAADVDHDDVELDDAESDYFESDDAESDIDSVDDVDSAEDDAEAKAEDTDNEGSNSQHG